MRPSRTRKPLPLNKHELSRLIYRFTWPFVLKYFLTDRVSHKVTQVIKPCFWRAENIATAQLSANVSCFQSQMCLPESDCKWRYFYCWWLLAVFQHCSDKNSRCRSEMNILAAWQRGYTGRNVVVTILDDGIERNHPDLAQNYVRLSLAPVTDHVLLL